MTSPTVDQIHFNPNDDPDQSTINVSNYREVSASFEREHLVESDSNKGGRMSHSDEYNDQIICSTKSYPGSLRSHSISKNVISPMSLNEFESGDMSLSQFKSKVLERYRTMLYVRALKYNLFVLVERYGFLFEHNIFFLE